MTELYNVLYDAFGIFFDGMPQDTYSLAVTGIMLAVGLFFAALPFLIFRRS